MSADLVVLNALMLGGRGYGKTCFMASTYNAMSFGVNDFLLTASGFDQRLVLDQFWTGISSGKCPDGTLEGQDLSFDCSYRYDPIMEVSWYDYPGGWINPTSPTDRDAYDELLNRMNTADFVMCCIPVDRLLEAYQKRRQLDCFKQYNKLFVEYGKRKPNRFPSVMYVITKADLAPGRDEVVEAMDLFVQGSPFKGEHWPEISVVPVSLGKDIEIEGQIIRTLDALDPYNIHVPILYAMVKKLRPLIADALSELDTLQEKIQHRKVDRMKLNSGILSYFRGRKKEDNESELEYLDQQRREKSRWIEAFAKHLENVQRELDAAAPLIYRDGKRESPEGIVITQRLQ